MDQCEFSLRGLQWDWNIGVLRKASSVVEAKAASFLWHWISFWYCLSVYLQSVLLIYIAVTLVKVRDTFNRDSNCSTVTYKLQQQPTIDMFM